MSETNSHQELPGKDDYIIPSEYYDRYRLIFSHFHLDKKLVRIGMNGNQKRTKAARRITNSGGASRTAFEAWGSIAISREANSLQEFATISSKISGSQHLLN